MYDASSNYGMAQGMDMGNTSGQGEGALVPAEIQGLNWGGFLWNWIWAIGNNAGALWIILGLFFSPFTNIYFLIKGNEIAWKNKQWASVEAFKATQAKWTRWGIIVLIGGVLLACVFIMLALVLAAVGGSSN